MSVKKISIEEISKMSLGKFENEFHLHDASFLVM